MKKLITILMAMLLCAVSAFPAVAESTDTYDLSGLNGTYIEPAQEDTDEEE